MEENGPRERKIGGNGSKGTSKTHKGTKRTKTKRAGEEQAPGVKGRRRSEMRAGE